MWRLTDPAISTQRSTLAQTFDSHASRWEGLPHWLLPMAVLLALIWFGPLDHRDLFHPDEGRYAEITREMVASGDWVTPHLNDLKYFEKPPLQYWATAIAYIVFGESAWTARLWPAALGFFGLLTTLVAGRALFGLRTGVVAALVLASSVQFTLFSQLATLDMGLTFFMSASLFCFLAAMRTGLTRQQEQARILCAWAMAALAVLSKGMIGVVLPALTLIIYTLIHRDWEPLRKTLWPPAIALFLAIAAPWFVLVQLRNPEFFSFFFIGEHFQRFLSPGHHRPGAWYYFIPVVLAGLMPWTSLLLPALPLAWRRPQESKSGIHVDRFLLLWAVVVVAFFSLSSSKLPGYVLPAFPALALLAARWSARAMPAQLGPHLVPGFATGVAMVLAGIMLQATSSISFESDAVGSIAWWLVGAGLVLALAFAIARFRLARGHALQALMIGALSVVVALQLLQAGAQNFTPQYSVVSLVASARTQFGEFDRNVPFYSVKTYDQTLPFELRRTVTLVAYADEMAMGLRIEPQKGIPTIGEFRERWRNDPSGYAIMPLPEYKSELIAGTPMQVLAQNTRLVLVRR
jgi:4-amino-4-deoxy-L-arabinose transferase-like glycosyltransferase